jgi:hypothetical protein
LTSGFNADLDLKNQDSYSGTTGTSDSTPFIHLFELLDPELGAIQCRRSRLRCQGCFACTEVDPALLNVIRYELDPTSRDSIVAAQIESRRIEGTTVDLKVATYVMADNLLTRKLTI